jgi:hypothetical protein
VIAGTACLAIGMTVAIYLVTDVVFHLPVTVTVTAVVAVVFVWFWYALPLLRRAE